MKIKRLLEFASVSVLSVSTLMTLAVPLAHAAVLTCTWTGATDLKFSTATNWTNCNATAPVVGDIVEFGSSTVAGGTFNLVNDLGFALGGAKLVSSGVSQTYFINTLTLADGATINNAQLPGAVYTAVYVGLGYANLAPLTAQGNLTIIGNGILSSKLNVAGDLTLSDGVFFNVTKTNLAVTGSIKVQNGAYITFNPETTVDSTLSTALVLGGGTGTALPVVSFESICGTGTGKGGCTYQAANWTVSSAITLLNDAYISPGELAKVTYTGALTGANFSLKVDPSAFGTLTLNPSSNSSKTVTGIQQPVKTTLNVTDSQPTVNLSVANNVTATLDGTRGTVDVGKGGILMGTGTAGNLYVATGGTLAPGHSPGCLSSSNLSLAGTYQAEIGGTDPCTGYDQMKVTGTVDVTVGTLVASLYNGFIPKVGQSYTIISNDAADAVTGTFTGIAEGGTYANQGVTYTVTYKGVDGNDVVLTVTAVDAAATPKKPDTGFSLVAAHPMVALATSTLAAAALLVAARKLRPSAK